jgi:hypothetical protein
MNMKNKYIYGYGCLALILSTGLFSCKKKAAATPANYFLNYAIPDVPPTSPYLVGAFYYDQGSNQNPFGTTWNTSALITIPALGPYAYPTSGASAGLPTAVVGGTYTNGGSSAPYTGGTVTGANLMAQQVAEAIRAKVDYLIFPLRAPSANNANYLIDVATINAFLASPNVGASGMHFAVMLSVNWSNGAYGTTITGGATGFGTQIENNPTQVTNLYNDINTMMTTFMNNPAYQKVNGKSVFVMWDSSDLNSANNVALYTQIRANANTILGHDLFIVGEQNRWSPPQRFYYRVQGCVDGLCEDNMADYAGNVDRYYIFPQECDQNYGYYNSYLASIGVEFVPTVQAAYNYQIASSTATTLTHYRNDGGLFYRTFTNIAKRSAGPDRMVFVDSFNDYSHDTQIEAGISPAYGLVPIVNYGTLYEDITAQEFKP